MPKFSNYFNEALGSSRPRSGYGREGNLIKARLAYHKALMDDGMSSAEAYEIVKKVKASELKKKGYLK